MAAMGLLLKQSSDSKPFLLPLKCRRNPLLRTTPPQIISLPSSMMIIKNSTTTTTSGFIQTISSSRGSDFRVQCVLNNNSNKNWFKEEEEEENPFERFGKVMLKVVNALEKPFDAFLIWLIVKDNPTFYLGSWLVCDLCMAIWSISSQYSRIRKEGTESSIEISLGAMLCSVLVFFAVVFGLGKNRKMTLEWTPSSKRSVFGFGLELEWTLSSKESVDAMENGDLKRQAEVIKEMVNAVVDSAFGSKDTELAGETAAQRPEAGSKKRAAHEEDPIAKGDDEEERTY